MIASAYDLPGNENRYRRGLNGQIDNPTLLATTRFLLDERAAVSRWRHPLQWWALRRAGEMLLDISEVLSDCYGDDVAAPIGTLHS